MNLRSVVETAALVSAHSPNVIESERPLPLAPMQRFWDASREQTRLWMARLADWPGEIASADRAQQSLLWWRIEPVFADVLAGGLVARVWAAVMTACDRESPGGAAEAIARSALSYHHGATRRALQLLVDGPQVLPERVARLDRLRRRLERWTDLLVGHLVHRYGVSGIAHDPERALDFGHEQLSDNRHSRPCRVWDLYLLCLRSSFPETELPGGTYRDLREEVFQSIFACFPRQAFLDHGPLAPVHLCRMLSGRPSREGRPVRRDRRSSAVGNWSRS